MNTEIIITHLKDFEILQYFLKNSSTLKDTLFKKVNLDEYSKKLSKFAKHFCAIDNNVIVGFMACYFNHPEKLYGFISSISVLPQYRNKGIATELIISAIKYAKEYNFLGLRLEVDKENIAAIKLYEKLGFTLLSATEKSYFYELLIS